MDCLQDHISTVRDYIDEPSSGASEWTDAQIVGYLNDEVRKVGLMIRKRKQDFMGCDVIIPCVTNTLTYEIPMGQIRKVELLTSGVTSEGNGVYAVAYNAVATELEPVEFHYMEDEDCDGWCLWGTEMRFTSDSRLATGNYLRLSMLRPLPKLFAGTMASATATTLVAAAASPTYGEAAKESNVYKGFGIKIYDGTGKGQERRITKDSYDGTNHTFTVDTWTTTPSGVVYFSLTPPFPDEFEEAIPMGAALTAKFRVEDKNPELEAAYATTIGTALDAYFPRNLNGSRRLRRRVDYTQGKSRIVVRS